MNLNLTIDANVFLQAILEEELTSAAISLFEHINNNDVQIINPTIFEYEVINLSIVNKLDLNIVDEILQKYKLINLKVLFPSLKCFKKIDNFTQTFSTDFYTTLYHLFAIEHNSIFVTADAKYYSKVPKSKNIILFSKDILLELWK